MTTRRFLSLWLPRLATDRARRLHDVSRAAPLAATMRIASAERLVCLDAAAAGLGLTVGLTLADARARHPGLVTVEADPAAEFRLLERLGDWCSRYTPLAGLDGRDGLMLDVSGVAHLFGGEKGLVEDARARLAAQGITVLAGVADAPRAAFALARFSATKIAPPGLDDKGFARLFHDLPLAALGLEAATLADMARAGLRRIGDVAMRPRAPITARFGPLPVARLDELRGLSRASIAPRFPPPDFLAERRFASPVQTVEAIEASLRKLADDLVVLLERQAKGARRVELALYRVDGAVRRIAVGASRALNDARAIRRLFAEKLASPQEDEIDVGFGIDLMRLSCLQAEPLAPSQGQIERAHEAERARALADLIDRLSARLGARAVTRREPVEAHLPEFAEASAPAVAGRGGKEGRHCEDPRATTRGEAIQRTGAAASGLLPPGLRPGGRNDDPSWDDFPAPAAPSRPLRLFARPEPIEALAEVPDGPPLRFRWRRMLHDVAAIEGPERIAPPWWGGAGGPTRDYFRAEDAQGRRFWLYREGPPGRERPHARWFMHGLFG